MCTCERHLFLVLETGDGRYFDGALIIRRPCCVPDAVYGRRNEMQCKEEGTAVLANDFCFV